MASDNDLLPARIVPPGRIIARELARRVWSWRHLAYLMRRPEADVLTLIRGERGIGIDDAIGLAKAFGTSAEFWVNLEADYREHLARRDDKDAG
ncbi:MAG: transcriptional regulator [Dehalococcoidia bacterium]|jgi:HTH-type transcriptional regulator/antitoxin HigA|nr:transcriptional regulator [Dehalococcoidia bacterium]